MVMSLVFRTFSFRKWLSPLYKVFQDRTMINLFLLEQADEDSIVRKFQKMPVIVFALAIICIKSI